jgi:hypothetical protein
MALNLIDLMLSISYAECQFVKCQGMYRQKCLPTSYGHSLSISMPFYDTILNSLSNSFFN